MHVRLSCISIGCDFQVAQHLSNTYGDRAVKIGKISTLTGKRWPIVGRKLHEDYPYTEAEVRAYEEHATSISVKTSVHDVCLCS